MGKPAQTPMVFLRAGGGIGFSPDCVKALAACGLSPDDFGTYDEVKARISAAKSKVWDYDQAKKNKTKLPPKPTAHDRYLANSEGGHLRQNALFQRRRGNFCQNEDGKLNSNYPGAAGYHADWAPCGPHFVGAGRGKRGSTHWLVGRREAEMRDLGKPGTKVKPEEIQKLGLDVAGLTAGKVNKKQVEGLEETAKRRREEEKEAREKRAKALQKTQAGAPGGPGSPKSSTQAVNKAAKCIDAFAEAGMDAMRSKVVSEFGTDEAYKKSKAKLQKAQDDARARMDQAKKAREDAEKQYKKGKISFLEMRRARREHGRAAAAYGDAKTKNESAKCLHEQAKKLKAFQEKNGGALPSMSGSVPSTGGKSAESKRPVYDETRVADTGSETM
jgi:hypothetical protein